MTGEGCYYGIILKETDGVPFLATELSGPGVLVLSSEHTAREHRNRLERRLQMICGDDRWSAKVVKLSVKVVNDANYESNPVAETTDP